MGDVVHGRLRPTVTAELSVSTTRVLDRAVEVHAVGVLNAATAALLACVVDAQLRAGRRLLRLNVERLRVTDGAGTGVLVDLRRRLTAAGGALILTGARPGVSAPIKRASFGREPRRRARPPIEIAACDRLRRSGA
jgi:anti-anti-sigma factor